MNKVPVLAFILMVAAPIFWAVSNIIAKIASDKAASKDEKLNMVSMVVWSGLVPPIPMLGLALMLDTPETLLSVLTNLIPLLVPIVALLSARIVLTEQLSSLQWIGFIVILAGLAIANINLSMIKNIFIKSKT